MVGNFQNMNLDTPLVPEENFLQLLVVRMMTNISDLSSIYHDVIVIKFWIKPCYKFDNDLNFEM